MHVLSTPPAFILSQDRTLIKSFVQVQKCFWHFSVPLIYLVLGFVVLNNSLRIFRVALLFICQSSFRCCPVSRNSFIISRLLLIVNNFFNYFFHRRFSRFSRWNFIIAPLWLFVKPFYNKKEFAEANSFLRTIYPYYIGSIVILSIAALTQ